MSTYPIDEPHIAALRWAAKHLAVPGPLANEYRRLAAGTKPEEVAWRPKHAALRAISTPSLAAALVRDLLGRCDVDSSRARIGVLSHGLYVRTISACLACYDRGGVAVTGGCKNDYVNDRALGQQHVPTLILTLLSALDLPEGERAEAALLALREAGR